MNDTHPGLLRSFNKFEGRKSKTFPRAAIIGRRGFPCSAIVSPTDEYVLVHLCEVCPEDVDRLGSQVFEGSQAWCEESSPARWWTEFRFNNWNVLVEFLEYLGSLETAITRAAAPAVLEKLCDFEYRSQAHMHTGLEELCDLAMS
mgnify:CR=1 FL=1